MALYRLCMKVGKAGGQKHYEYINREGRYKHYNKGEDLVYSKSENLPDFCSSALDYWKTVNLYEKGTHYREFELALPNELNEEQNIKLTTEFCQKTFGRNYTYSFAIHKNKGSLSGKENPHAHIMFSERKIDQERKQPDKLNYFKRQSKCKDGSIIGGYKKDRTITGKDRKSWLLDKRKRWEQLQNQYLQHYGHDQSVSCETLERQAIQRQPQIHLGREVVRMQQKGQQTQRWELNQQIKEFNYLQSELFQLQLEKKWKEKEWKALSIQFEQGLNEDTVDLTEETGADVIVQKSLEELFEQSKKNDPPKKSLSVKNEKHGDLLSMLQIPLEKVNGKIQEQTARLTELQQYIDENDQKLQLCYQTMRELKQSKRMLDELKRDKDRVKILMEYQRQHRSELIYDKIQLYKQAKDIPTLLQKVFVGGKTDKQLFYEKYQEEIDRHYQIEHTIQSLERSIRYTHHNAKIKVLEERLKDYHIKLSDLENQIEEYTNIEREAILSKKDLTNARDKWIHLSKAKKKLQNRNLSPEEEYSFLLKEMQESERRKQGRSRGIGI